MDPKGGIAFPTQDLVESIQNPSAKVLRSLERTFPNVPLTYYTLSLLYRGLIRSNVMLPKGQT